jgi:hypothetical protein
MYLSDEESNEVMSKLFEAVGKKFVSIDRSCKGESWYTKYAWTQNQENEFEKWLKQYAMKKLKIPAKLAEKKAKMFCFNYGWKYSDA